MVNLRLKELEAVDTDEEVTVRVDFQQVTELCIKPQTSVNHNKHFTPSHPLTLP